MLITFLNLVGSNFFLLLNVFFSLKIFENRNLCKIIEISAKLVKLIGEKQNLELHPRKILHYRKLTRFLKKVHAKNYGNI